MKDEPTVPSTHQAMAQKQRTKTVTETMSIALLKNMLRTSFSHVTYMRNMFPHNCYRPAWTPRSRALIDLAPDATVRQSPVSQNPRLPEHMRRGIYLTANLP